MAPTFDTLSENDFDLDEDEIDFSGWCLGQQVVKDFKLTE